MNPALRLPLAWNTEADEAERPYPCDGLIARPDHTYYRAISVSARPGTVFRWLCQLKAAPYSYDWIDNLGRKSPARLIPGLESLGTGDRVMTIFTLASFEPGVHMTLLMTSPRAVRLFGRFAITYRLAPLGQEGTRLVAKLIVRYNRGWNGILMRNLLPWGDFLMMRKQMLVLKSLSESIPAG